MNKTKVWLMVLGIGLLSFAVTIVLSRYHFWNQKGWRKNLGAHLVALPGHLNGLTKGDVIARLGKPERRSDCYALILLREPDSGVGMTADLLLQVDSNNLVTNFCYAWRDFAAFETNKFDWRGWRTNSVESKISMTADLLDGWHNGRFKDKLDTLDDVEAHLGTIEFFDEWIYPVADSEALFVRFDKAGKVKEARVGYDD
jgi:hypothetical protein